MSFQADSSNDDDDSNAGHESEIEQNGEEQIKLLKAILAGIALVSSTKPTDLIELAKDL